MNKPELIDKVAAKAGLDRQLAERLLDAFVSIVIESLQKNEEVTLTGFGTFSARVREARMGVNPRNPAERIRIPTVTVPKFKAGKTLKDSLKHNAEADDNNQAVSQSVDTAGSI